VTFRPSPEAVATAWSASSHAWTPDDQPPNTPAPGQMGLLPPPGFPAPAPGPSVSPQRLLRPPAYLADYVQSVGDMASPPLPPAVIRPGAWVPLPSNATEILGGQTIVLPTGPPESLVHGADGRWLLWVPHVRQ